MCSGQGRERGGGKCRDARRRSCCGERQGAHDDALRELDLEGVVAGGLAHRRARPRRPSGRLHRSGCAPFKASSAARARQGLAATPPSASRASVITPLLDLQARGGGDDRESIGGALANLQVARMRREVAQPQPAAARATIRSPGSSTLSRSGAVAGQTMKLLERNLAPSASALDLDHRIERDQRHAEVRGVRGDAGVAPAEHGVRAVLAAARVAAGTGLALVAGAGRIVEIAASRALQQVAADGRGIAQLRRGAGQQRLGDRRIGLRRSPRRARGRHCGPARRCACRHRANARSGRGPADA